MLHRLLRRLLPLALLAALALPLAVPGSAAVTTAGTTTVSIGDFFFSPATANVPSGNSVTWTNQGGVTHTATSLAAPADFNTGSLAPGASATRALAPGTYPYQCAIHASMRGTVQVGPNTAPSVSTGLAEGATVSGLVTLTGAAPDPEGPHTWVTVRVDGSALTGGVLGLQTSGPSYGWSVAWDTRILTNGAHTLTISATDGALSASPVTRHVTVSNPPFVDLSVLTLSQSTDLAAGTVTLSGLVSNGGNAASGAFDLALTYAYKGSEHPIGTVRFAEGSVAARGTAPFSVAWDVKGKVGTWIVTARADAAGEVAESNEGNNDRSVAVDLLLRASPVDAFDP